MIKREVTVFSTRVHQLGKVVTGWIYKDGKGKTPFYEYCYFLSLRADGVAEQTNIATNRVPATAGVSTVPDLAGAVQKCTWFGTS